MSGNAQSIAEIGLNTGSKRKSDPKNWKNSMRKYNKPGEKKLKDPCSCKLKCFEKITEEERKNIMNDYHELGDINRQRDFHVAHTKSVPKGRCRTESENSRRDFTRTYELNGQRVCKVMYCNTLAITDQTITTALKKKEAMKSQSVCSKDQRGGNNKKWVEGREKKERFLPFLKYMTCTNCGVPSTAIRWRNFTCTQKYFNRTSIFLSFLEKKILVFNVQGTSRQ